MKKLVLKILIIATGVAYSSFANVSSASPAMLDGKGCNSCETICNKSESRRRNSLPHILPGGYPELQAGNGRRNGQ
ncbi:MAG: hypothetical protein HY696_00895 [Deltaproteobacteria bacterium]|nr:hypothetical protein [Deltaproteobacteria bacterium]